MDLSKALRNAIEIERAASRFYQKLASKASEGRARAFLERLSAEETSHAETFEKKSRDLVEGKLPDWPDLNLEHVEAAAPDWGFAEDINYEQALQLALEAEQHAELFYDALADMVTAKAVQDFFREVAQFEKIHAAVISELIEQHQLSTGASHR